MKKNKTTWKKIIICVLAILYLYNHPNTVPSLKKDTLAASCILSSASFKEEKNALLLALYEKHPPLKQQTIPQEIKRYVHTYLPTNTSIEVFVYQQEMERHVLVCVPNNSGLERAICDRLADILIRLYPSMQAWVTLPGMGEGHSKYSFSETNYSLEDHSKIVSQLDIFIEMAIIQIQLIPFSRATLLDAKHSAENFAQKMACIAQQLSQNPFAIPASLLSENAFNTLLVPLTKQCSDVQQNFYDHILPNSKRDLLAFRYIRLLEKMIIGTPFNDLFFIIWDKNQARICLYRERSNNPSFDDPTGRLAQWYEEIYSAADSERDSSSCVIALERIAQVMRAINQHQEQNLAKKVCPGKFIFWDDIFPIGVNPQQAAFFQGRNAQTLEKKIKKRYPIKIPPALYFALWDLQNKSQGRIVRLLHIDQIRAMEGEFSEQSNYPLILVNVFAHNVVGHKWYSYADLAKRSEKDLQRLIPGIQEALIVGKQQHAQLLSLFPKRSPSLIRILGTKIGNFFRCNGSVACSA